MAYQASKLGLVQFTYRDTRGSTDYWGVLTVEFGEEEGQWVGLCKELGTATHADTLAEVEVDMCEAIDLQLNEMALITDVREYLDDSGVSIYPISVPQETGFAVASSVFIP